MKPTRKLSRRSFFAAVAGGVATAGLVGVVGVEPAEAQSGCSDSDSGRYGDPAGNGRRCGAVRGRRTGCTDRDSGRYADGVGYGRRCGGRRRTGITDRDSGPGSDPAQYGRGRRRRSCTDSDTGRYGDPAGRGRRC
jgi:hypothetical protein